MVCPQDMHNILDTYEKVHVNLLYKLRLNLEARHVTTIRAKLRVYFISDQDDTGSWNRRTFPDIFCNVSAHTWNYRGMATWTGISGDKFYGFD
jgi:hypothetical protein